MKYKDAFKSIAIDIHNFVIPPSLVIFFIYIDLNDYTLEKSAQHSTG